MPGFIKGMPNKRPGADAGLPLLFAFVCARSRAAQAGRCLGRTMKAIIQHRSTVPRG
jgi:hypothetical protein